MRLFTAGFCINWSLWCWYFKLTDVASVLLLAGVALLIWRMVEWARRHEASRQKA